MEMRQGLVGVSAVLAAGLGGWAAVPAAAVGTAGTRGAAVRAAVGNPLAGNLGFGTIVERDVLLGSTETEGTVALGGNLAFGPGYNVMIHQTGTYTAPGESSPTALLVGGRISTTGSASDGVLKVLNNGYVHVGDMAGISALATDSNGASVNTHIVAAGSAYDSVPRVELTTRETPSAVGPFTSPIDFTSLFATYRERARQIADCPQNVTLTDAAGTALPQQTGFGSGTQAYVTLTPGRTNVLHLTGADLNNLSELSFRTQPTAATPFVVVVDPVSTPYLWHVPNLPGVSGPQAPYMLWDFPTATDITMTSGDSLEGTIYAPSAHLVDLDASNIEGDIAVRSFEAGPPDGNGGYTNAGEIHDFPFAAELDCVGTETGTATPTTASPTDTGASPTPDDGNSPNTGSESPGSPSADSSTTPVTPTTSGASGASGGSTPAGTPVPSGGPSSPGSGPQLAQTGFGDGVALFGGLGALAALVGAALLTGVRARRH
ncbi:MAG TPA: collagen-binding domain-containing protein [Actinospica sp.]|jgi:choice-of-anchor A domain-containing protein|nr:collagen-binding domain-containing protein [Actinospica sp.]